MANDPVDRTDRPDRAGIWLWLVVGGGLLFLLAWLTRFPWGWF
jgi:hypothetical protein